MVPDWCLSSAGKESTCNAGDTGDTVLIPGSGRSPGGGKWQPTPVFLPEKSHGQSSLEGNNPECHKEFSTTGRLSTWCLTETERRELCLLMKLENMGLEMSSQVPRLESFMAKIISTFPSDRKILSANHRKNYFQNQIGRAHV